MGWKLSTTCAWDDTIGRKFDKKSMQKINLVDPKYVLIKYKIQEFEVDLTWCGF